MPFSLGHACIRATMDTNILWLNFCVFCENQPAVLCPLVELQAYFQIQSENQFSFYGIMQVWRYTKFYAVWLEILYYPIRFDIYHHGTIQKGNDRIIFFYFHTSHTASASAHPPSPSFLHCAPQIEWGKGGCCLLTLSNVVWNTESPSVSTHIQPNCFSLKKNERDRKEQPTFSWPAML